MEKLFWLMASLLLLLTGCGSAPDKNLTAANTALSQMVSNRILSRSCFTVAYPDGQAADFIDYMFSDLGSAEWPVAFDEYEEQLMNQLDEQVLREIFSGLCRRVVAGCGQAGTQQKDARVDRHPVAQCQEAVIAGLCILLKS